MDILLVDGYNIIGAWAELRELRNKDLEQARVKLIEKMAEYKAYSGYRVIVVFDAQLQKEKEKHAKKHGVEIIFTRNNETADEKIERLAVELINKKRRTQVHVATSDYTEQWQVFGQGALRKSARELFIEMNSIESKIENKVKKISAKQPPSKLPLTPEVVEKFEKWRRGNLE